MHVRKVYVGDNVGGKLGSSVGDAVGRREGSIVGYTFRKRQAINAAGWPRMYVPYGAA